MLRYEGYDIAKDAFEWGDNVTETLRAHLGSVTNSQEIIEMAYDMQAGSYVWATIERMSFYEERAEEIAAIYDDFLGSDATVLDVGTGELTTVSLVAKHLETSVRAYYACDISWSRVASGIAFAEQNMGLQFARLVPFVADIGEILLLDKSIDAVVSYCALEPNGGREVALLSEMFRVARSYLLFCEPSYERNTSEGRARMERFGYVKGLVDVACKLGGEVLELRSLDINSNPLNPVVCYVIAPPLVAATKGGHDESIWADPVAKTPLQEYTSFYWSPSTGLSYPVIGGLPILRSDSAVLTTAMSRLLAAGHL